MFIPHRRNASNKKPQCTNHSRPKHATYLKIPKYYGVFECDSFDIILSDEGNALASIETLSEPQRKTVFDDLVDSLSSTLHTKWSSMAPAECQELLNVLTTIATM